MPFFPPLTIVPHIPSKSPAPTKACMIFSWKIKSLFLQGGTSVHLFATRGCCFVSSQNKEVFFSLFCFFFCFQIRSFFLPHLLPAEAPQIAKQYFKQALTSSENHPRGPAWGCPARKGGRKERMAYHGYKHKPKHWGNTCLGLQCSLCWSCSFIQRRIQRRRPLEYP